MIKILHLEDDRRDAEQINWALKKSGLACDIRLVDTRADYQSALADFAPEIVISDHSLPAFNSIQALKLLRSSGLRIPFILVTGAVSEAFAADAMREGVDDYILKDRPQRLSSSIRNAVEKYQLQRERLASETMLRNIDANSLDIICTIDREGRFLHASAACVSIWGYQPFELIGKKAMEFVFAEDLDITANAVARVRSGVPVTMLENRHVRRDGTVVPMLWSARCDQDTGVIYCIAKDASEKKKIEQVLRTEQQRFVDLFLEAPASIGILKGPDHIFQMLNPRHREFMASNNIIGRRFADVSPELTDQGIVKILDRVYHSGETFCATESPVKIVRSRNGVDTVLYYNFVVQPIRTIDGAVEGIFFFGVDVSEQVHARKMVEESGRQYVDLVQNLPIAVYTCDHKGRIRLYNKAAAALWGRTPSMGREHWCGSWRLYDNQNNPIPHDCSPLAQAIKEPGNLRHAEIVIERPDGSRSDVIPYPYVTRDAAGRVTGAVNVLIDITDRKKAEAETMRLVDQLTFRNKELRQFAYMISHNLRAPIARILGLASIITADPETDGKLLDQIVEETSNLDGVVKDLNVILSARNPVKEKSQRISLKTKFDLVLKVLEEEIRESNAVITSQLELDEISSLKTYLHSILFNLISNAIKYRALDRALHIHLHAREADGHLVLSVEDNGMGIDLQKNGPAMFGLYKRFHGNGIPGKGVGLHLVKTHVESLGGRVEVESEINKGTVFRIFLPLSYEKE